MTTAASGGPAFGPVVPIKPIMQYVGSKMGLAPRIVELLGPHRSYIEPYCGSAAVLLAKPRVPVELINDFDRQLITLYRLLQKRETRYELMDALTYTPYSRHELEVALGMHDPEGYHFDHEAAKHDAPVELQIEWARRYMIKTNQRFLGAHSATWTSTIRGSSGHSNASKWQNYRERVNALVHRLEEVQIDCDDAHNILKRLRNRGTADEAVYLDPPYVTESRTRRLYLDDEWTEHHVKMLEYATALRGPTVVSAYESALYDDTLGPSGAGWNKYMIDVKASSQAGKGSIAKRVEVLWANPRCPVPTGERWDGTDSESRARLTVVTDDEDEVS